QWPTRRGNNQWFVSHIANRQRSLAGKAVSRGQDRSGTDVGDLASDEVRGHVVDDRDGEVGFAELDGSDCLVAIPRENAKLHFFHPPECLERVTQQVHESALSCREYDRGVSRSGTEFGKKLLGALLLLASEGEHTAPLSSELQRATAAHIQRRAERFA